MDKSAIEQIQTTALAAALTQRLTETDCPIAILPKDFAIHSLEPYQSTRNRYRGQFSTTSLTDFAEYTSVWDADACYIDAENMTAISIINQGTQDMPGHCDHRAALTLQQSAPYRALLKINSARLTQRELAEWLEEWRDCLQYDAPEEIKPMIAAIRRLTVTAKAEQTRLEGNFGSSRTALESIDAKGADAELPPFISFSCLPYEALSEHTFILRLSLITGETAPLLCLKIQQADTAVEQIAQDFKETLRDMIDTKKTDIYIGRFAP